MDNSWSVSLEHIICQALEILCADRVPRHGRWQQPTHATPTISVADWLSLGSESSLPKIKHGMQVTHLSDYVMDESSSHNEIRTGCQQGPGEGTQGDLSLFKVRVKGFVMATSFLCQLLVVRRVMLDLGHAGESYLILDRSLSQLAAHLAKPLGVLLRCDWPVKQLTWQAANGHGAAVTLEGLSDQKITCDR